MKAGLVSVIIPKTRKEDISECLETIQDQTYPHVETIVVDEGLERSLQRNIGISRAKGEFLLFLDADQFISMFLIEECVSRMRKDDEVKGIYIPEIIVTSGWFGKLRNWERQFYTSTEIDCVRFVRSKGCPLFDCGLTGPEDSDWDKKIGGKRAVSYHNLYHRDNVGVFKYLEKKAYYSKSMKAYESKWPNAKVLQFKYRCWTVFTENGKWVRLLKSPHKAIAVYILIFVRGVIYLWQR